jgi:hypothetical protein
LTGPPSRFGIAGRPKQVALRAHLEPFHRKIAASVSVGAVKTLRTGLAGPKRPRLASLQKAHLPTISPRLRPGAATRPHLGGSTRISGPARCQGRACRLGRHSFAHAKSLAATDRGGTARGEGAARVPGGCPKAFVATLGAARAHEAPERAAVRGWCPRAHRRGALGHHGADGTRPKPVVAGASNIDRAPSMFGYRLHPRRVVPTAA